MDPERWERVKAVYHSAVERDLSDRAAFLEQACRDDPELRRQERMRTGWGSGGFRLALPGSGGLPGGALEEGVAALLSEQGFEDRFRRRCLCCGTPEQDPAEKFLVADHGIPIDH